jgi:hypothetical protein
MLGRGLARVLGRLLLRIGLRFGGLREPERIVSRRRDSAAIRGRNHCQDGSGDQKRFACHAVPRPPVDRFPIAPCLLFALSKEADADLGRNANNTTKLRRGRARFGAMAETKQGGAARRDADHMSGVSLPGSGGR